jgi:hypothetical protein
MDMVLRLSAIHEHFGGLRLARSALTEALAEFAGDPKTDRLARGLWQLPGRAAWPEILTTAKSSPDALVRETYATTAILIDGQSAARLSLDPFRRLCYRRYWTH